MSGAHVLGASDFTPTAVALLVTSAVAALAFAVYFVIRWATSFPDLPAPGPEVPELGPEPPAVANLLVNRCRTTTAAAAATLIDLAARRHLDVFGVGPERFALRLRSAPDDRLTDYEEQVLALVRERATGGSAPLEAIELDHPTAAAWRRRFGRSVLDDARGRGLLRGRWTRTDWTVLGVLAAIALLLLAAGLYAAEVEQAAERGDDGFDRDGWFVVAIGAWLLLMAGLRSLRSVRYSAAGEAAAARWLGVKRFLQHDHTFGETPPSGVAIWNRLLAYGAGLGVARGAVAAIPLEAEDPDVAWSRVGGDWHQVNVEYPTRFGYGERPRSVLVNGLLRAMFFGAIAFVALPTVTRVVWDAATDLLDSMGSAAAFGIVALFVVVFGAIGVTLVVLLADGLIRLTRGFADLGVTTTVTGQVVKHHRTVTRNEQTISWFAVDPGDVDEVRAFHPGDDGEMPPRGAIVDVTFTPRLRHVVSADVREPAAADRG